MNTLPKVDAVFQQGARAGAHASTQAPVPTFAQHIDTVPDYASWSKANKSRYHRGYQIGILNALILTDMTEIIGLLPLSDLEALIIDLLALRAKYDRLIRLRYPDKAR